MHFIQTICLVFLLMGVNAFGQVSLDSLMQLGKQELSQKNYTVAEKWYNQALDLVHTDDEPNLKAAIIKNNLGITLRGQEQYDKSINAYLDALELYQKTENDSLIAQSHYNLGKSLKEIGSYKIALQNFLQSYRLYKKINDETGEANVLEAVGNIYKNTGKYQLAITFHNAAMRIYYHVNYEKGISRCYHNLGQVYLETHKLDSAKYCLFQAKRIKENLGFSLGANYGQIGQYYIQKRQLDSAEYYFKASLEERQRGKVNRGLTTSYLHLADLYFVEGKISRSEQYANKAYDIAEKLALKEELADIIQLKINIAKHKGTISDSASHYYEELILLNDQISGEQSIQAMVRFNVEYQTYKRKLQIEQQEKELEIQTVKNESLFITLTVAIVSGMIVLLFAIRLARQKRQTDRQNRILAEKNNTIAYLNKELNHRTKNYFHMLSGMLVYDRRQINKETDVEELLTQYIRRTAAMSQIQHYLLYDDNDVVTNGKVHLNRYFSELTAELELALNNRSPKVMIETDFEDIKIDYEKGLRLAIAMNELVQNAFKYAFSEIKHPKISITLGQQDYYYELIVTDNGIGIDPDKKRTGRSLGVEIIHMLLTGVGGTMNYANESEGGVTVMIRVPVA